MRKLSTTLIILVILAGAGYFAYSRNWGPSNWVKRTLGLSGDAKITANVKSALGLSKRLSAFDIGVSTKESVVTLSGQVSSEAAKALAGDLAADVEGVADVKNEIAVDRAAQPANESGVVSDLEIKTAILEALTHSSELSGKNINVKVENRVVSLSGSVDTPAQRNGAEQLAGSASGVAGVRNELTVNNPTAPGEPPASPPAATADPNADLAKRVKFELYESGAFDTLTINVAAENGTITLTGTVRTKAEQSLATFVTQGTPGTKKVVNQLQVAPPVVKK